MTGSQRRLTAAAQAPGRGRPPACGCRPRACRGCCQRVSLPWRGSQRARRRSAGWICPWPAAAAPPARGRSADRKSTRLNSSHVRISYAVFCLKKKKKKDQTTIKAKKKKQKNKKKKKTNKK